MKNANVVPDLNMDHPVFPGWQSEMIFCLGSSIIEGSMPCHNTRANFHQYTLSSYLTISLLLYYITLLMAQVLLKLLKQDLASKLAIYVRFWKTFVRYNFVADYFYLCIEGHMTFAPSGGRIGHKTF